MPWKLPLNTSAKGPYDAVADVLTGEEKFCILLEFDDERSGFVSNFAKVPEDKKVVLGLVTTKRPGAQHKAILRCE